MKHKMVSSITGKTVKHYSLLLNNYNAEAVFHSLSEQEVNFIANKKYIGYFHNHTIFEVLHTYIKDNLAEHYLLETQ